MSEQVMLITGASSGIGLSTARKAAEQGVRLVLVARNEEALRNLVAELESQGREAVYAVADVADEQALRRAADVAVERFGRIDTWVNNAAVSIFGDILQTDPADHRRLIETNYWGVVHGSLIAVERMREHGGVLINLGSVVSDRAVIRQPLYSVSKHAVRGFTDGLRMEMEESGLPIAVCLIKPGSIDTPYLDHARNYLEHEPATPPPVYAPEAVAKAILHCAVRPRRQMYVGGGGAVLAFLGTRFPRLTDRIMVRSMAGMQETDRPRSPDDEDNLHTPMDDGQERGGHPYHVSERSLYTTAMRHPVASGAALAALAAGVMAVVRLARKS